MGGFAGVLGHAAGGFEQAHQQDLQRQFLSEQGSRQAGLDIFKTVLTDPNQPDAIRNAALEGYMGIVNTPYGKFKLEKATAPLQQLLAQHRAAQLAGQNAPPPPPFQTNVPRIQAQGAAPQISAGQPIPLPPGVAGPPQQGPPQMTGGGSLNLPAMQARVQGPPPPPQSFLAGVPQLAQNAATLANAQARGTVGGQIGARQEALQGIPLPPEQQAAMALGMPQILYRGLSKVNYVDPVTGQQALGTYNEMTREVIGQNGQVVPNAVPLIPSLLPSIHENTIQVPQLDGTIKAYANTTVNRKMLGLDNGEQPKAGVKEGATIGGKAPTPVTMIAPPTEPGGQARAVAVRPGSSVPSGVVTPAGLSSVSVPTSNTRTRSEFATGLLPAVDRAIVDVQHAAPKLGALKGRWNEFIAGRLGGGLDDDPEISGLRTELGLIQTGMMVPHVGARGGVQLMNKFKSMIDQGKMDAPQLTSALKQMRQFLVTYAKEGQLKGWGNEPMEGAGGPPTQGPSGHMSFSEWKQSQGQ